MDGKVTGRYQRVLHPEAQILTCNPIIKWYLEQDFHFYMSEGGR